MKDSARNEVYFVSADRGPRADSWTRECRHRHSSIDDADRCAEKRNAGVVVCDPAEALAPAIIDAPYLKVRRERARIVREAEALLSGTSDAQRVFVLENDGGRRLRCRGTLLAHATSRETQTQDRWTEITIVKTDKGGYAVGIVGCSSRPGEVNRYKAVAVQSARDAVDALQHPTQKFLSIVADEAIREAAKLDSAFSEAMVEDI